MGVFHTILAPLKIPVHHTEEDVKAPRDRKLGHCGGPLTANGRRGQNLLPLEPRWTSGELKIVPSGYD